MTLRENRLPQQAHFSLPPSVSQKILLATRNAHKTQEVRAILGDGWHVTDLLAHPELPEVEETGTTFAENAALKAVAGSRHFPDGWVIADDSGLEVDALGGAPGVYSARYAGPDADDEANRQKLVRELRAVLLTRAAPRRRGSGAASRWRAGARSWRNSTARWKGSSSRRRAARGASGTIRCSSRTGYQDTFAELPPRSKTGSATGRRRCGRRWSF